MRRSEDIVHITRGGVAPRLLRACGYRGRFLADYEDLTRGQVVLASDLHEWNRIRGPNVHVLEGHGSRAAGAHEIVDSIGGARQVALWFGGGVGDLLFAGKWSHILQGQRTPPVVLRPLDGALNPYARALGEAIPELIREAVHEVPIESVIGSHLRELLVAFTAPAPDALVAFLVDGALGGRWASSLAQLLLRYPDISSGTSRIQWLFFQLLSEGPRRLVELQQEMVVETLGWTDDILWDAIARVIEDLTSAVDGRTPLAESESDPATGETVVSLTPTGMRVARGSQSLFDLLDRDYWLGGVHQINSSYWARRHNGSLVHVASGRTT